MENINYLLPVAGALALIYAAWKSSWINRQDAGDENMTEIAKHIRDGAMAFLGREYRVLAVFVVAAAALLSWANASDEASSPLIGLSLVAGAVCSALAGFLGMRVATSANVRTAAAARTSLNQALGVAFSGGAVMGFAVVGLGLLGLSLLFIVYSSMFGAGDNESLGRVVTVLTGFSFGASSIALFARVGGGIYTKAADVGADLVGKVEAASRRTIHATPRSSPTTSVTTSVMLPEWGPICSSPMSAPLWELWFSAFRRPQWAVRRLLPS